MPAEIFTYKDRKTKITIHLIFTIFSLNNQMQICNTKTIFKNHLCVFPIIFQYQNNTSRTIHQKSRCSSRFNTFKIFKIVYMKLNSICFYLYLQIEYNIDYNTKQLMNKINKIINNFILIVWIYTVKLPSQIPFCRQNIYFRQ